VSRPGTRRPAPVGSDNGAVPLSARTSRFSRSRGLPREVYDSWAASLRTALTPGQVRPVRVLAWAPSEQDGPPSFCIGSPAALSWGSTETWRHVGWHEIEHGGWNDELRRLSWVQLDGRRGSVPLAEPARLPELFRERVEASIVVKRFLPLAGERGVQVSARRDLGGSGPITWHTSLTRGLSLRTPGVADGVEEALQQVRAEYDLG